MAIFLKHLSFRKTKTVSNNIPSIRDRGLRCTIIIFCIISGFIMMPSSYGQKNKMTKEEKKAIMRDTLDGKLDFSRFLIDAKGFIPVPIIITEPALGGFGGLMAAMFFTPKKNTSDKEYIPPDITAAAAMYTVNGSWLGGGGRMGSIPKAGLKYRAFLGYCNINLNFYRELLNGQEKELEFELDALPVLLSLSKEISKTDIYLGLQYSYSSIKAKPKFESNLPPSIKPEELDNNIGSMGFFFDWDKRNSIFTADKGARVNVMYSINDNWTGSSFEFQKLYNSLNWFLPLKPNWISGLRAEVQHVFDTPPFYVYPYINLRGIPITRYQGTTTTLMETEQRFDFSKRWSAVAFAGIGKAIQKDESFGQAETVYNYGTGFRYLLARAFKLRAGIDIAKGPDSFGWYIVFGHNWNR